MKKYYSARFQDRNGVGLELVFFTDCKPKTLGFYEACYRELRGGYDDEYINGLELLTIDFIGEFAMRDMQEGGSLAELALDLQDFQDNGFQVGAVLALDVAGLNFEYEFEDALAVVDYMKKLLNEVK